MAIAVEYIEKKRLIRSKIADSTAIAVEYHSNPRKMRKLFHDYSRGMVSKSTVSRRFHGYSRGIILFHGSPKSKITLKKTLASAAPSAGGCEGREEWGEVRVS